MKMKNLLKGLVVGATMLTFAGAAVADDTNLYGASAQFLFWTQAAPGFLTSQGCVAPTGHAALQCAQKFESDGTTVKNSIIWAKCGGVDTYFRVSSKASYDGICALESNYGGTNPNCTADAAGPTFRQMVSEGTCGWADCNAAGTSWGTCTGTKSVVVTIGASDVLGESFVQQSHGLLKGNNAGAQTDRVFTGMPTKANTATHTPNTLLDCQPLVVPFGFYVNNNVKRSGAAVTNMTRMMSVMIFSGQAFNWTDFGTDFTVGLPISVCMRHAGSGTHATLDWAIMNHSGLGLAQVANNDTVKGFVAPPTIYFNDGSGDEMNCVNQVSGAVGYADADQANVVGAGKKYPNIVAMTYNGEFGNRINIRNGIYDNFWSNQNLYYVTSTPWITALCAHASNPTNIPTGEAGYWATSCEMNYEKALDSDYPGFTGATCPQTP